MWGAMAAQGGQSGMSQGFGFAGNARLAGEAWDRQKKWALRSPKYHMMGLERAGINPIIAAGGGIQTGATRAPQASGPGGGARSSQALLQGSQKKLMAAQERAQDAAASASIQQALNTSVNTALQSTKMPSAAYLQQLFSSPEGQSLLRQQEINNALPNTWPAMGGKAAYSIFTNPDFLKRLNDLGTMRSGGQGRQR